jgi:membrane protein
MGPKQVWRLLKEGFHEWNQDKVPWLAAALAYYTIFSIAPLLILALPDLWLKSYKKLQNIT